MRYPQLIVWESGRRWGDWLRAQFPEPRWVLQQVTSRDACRTAAVRCHGSFVLVEAASLSALVLAASFEMRSAGSVVILVSDPADPQGRLAATAAAGAVSVLGVADAVDSLPAIVARWAQNWSSGAGEETHGAS